MPSWSENWISLGLRLVGHWELIVLAAAVTTNEVVQLHLLARSLLWGPPGGRRSDLFIWSLDRQLPRYTLLTLDNMLGWVAKMLTCVCLFSLTMSICYLKDSEITGNSDHQIPSELKETFSAGNTSVQFIICWISISKTTLSQVINSVHDPIDSHPISWD